MLKFFLLKWLSLLHFILFAFFNCCINILLYCSKVNLLPIKRATQLRRAEYFEYKSRNNLSPLSLKYKHFGNRLRKIGHENIGNVANTSFHLKEHSNIALLTGVQFLRIAENILIPQNRFLLLIKQNLQATYGLIPVSIRRIFFCSFYMLLQNAQYSYVLTQRFYVRHNYYTILW